MSVVSPDAGETIRSRVSDRIQPYAGLVGLLVAVLAVGLAIEAFVGDPGSVLAPYRLFFQLIVAGVVLSVLQNEVGLSTYGLFGPMIIAFILVAAGPFWGLALFLNVFVVTLVAFYALKPLELGTGPRVAMLLAVACLATMITRLLADLGQLPVAYQSAAVSFPVVISAWYAEQMATDIEERGWTIPAVQLLWTLVSIVVAYLVVTSPLIDWFMGSPAAWAGTLGGLAWISSRPTFRLTEFFRFDGHIADNPALAVVTTCQVKLHNARVSVANYFGYDIEPKSASTILPMKVRNLYIDRYNPDHARPAADRKAELKSRLNGLGVAAPDTYTVARETADLTDLRTTVEGLDEFVLKPSQGYGGEGVLIAFGRTDDGFETNNGPLTADDVMAHARRIVEGDYAGLEPSGEAVLEERLIPSPFFGELCGQGVPDIRVIVFQGYPVMTMTRLPTAESGGAANLHQGGIGVGLALADGTPLGAYQQTTDRWLDAHPDTGAAFGEFCVPNWRAVLETAVKSTAATGLGYAGVDIVLDEDDQPKVLEVNVRPGLGIQNTTQDGILRRLEFIESLPATYEFCAPAEKVSLARGWAGDDWEASVAPDPTQELGTSGPRRTTAGSESPSTGVMNDD
ncbi:MAG: sugar-transfer associated ATP-grasp domain-containing protein [Halovenus sp.]